MIRIAIPGTLTSAVEKPVVEASEVFDVQQQENQETLNQSFIKKVPGKGLSTNDYTDEDKANVQDIPRIRRIINIVPTDPITTEEIDDMSDNITTG